MDPEDFQDASAVLDTGNDNAESKAGERRNTNEVHNNGIMDETGNRRYQGGIYGSTSMPFHQEYDMPTRQPALVPSSLQMVNDEYTLESTKHNVLLLKVMTSIRPKYNGRNFQSWRQTTIKGWAVKLGLASTITGRNKHPDSLNMPVTQA
jgi:hypothetical protein